MLTKKYYFPFYLKINSIKECLSKIFLLGLGGEGERALKCWGWEIDNQKSSICCMLEAFNLFINHLPTRWFETWKFYSSYETQNTNSKFPQKSKNKVGSSCSALSTSPPGVSWGSILIVTLSKLFFRIENIEFLSSWM